MTQKSIKKHPRRDGAARKRQGKVFKLERVTFYFRIMERKSVKKNEK